MTERKIHQAVPLPPPPSNIPSGAPAKRSRKKLYAIILIAIVAVAIIVPVFLLIFNNGGSAANASTLKYSQISRYVDPSTGAEMQDIYRVYVKNFGTPNVLSRYEGTFDGEQVIGITDDGAQQSWTYYQGQWSDSSFMYNATISAQSWAELKNALRSWNGAGEVKFTFQSVNVTIYDIEVNPYLPDELFQR